MFKKDSTEQYFESLRREIEIVTDAGFHFDELYVGGGTPTVLPNELMNTILFARERHTIEKTSVETNPDDLANENVLALRDAGVNRLSVGVQSFDDTLLHEMQRFEKYGSGAEIRDRLRKTEGLFDTINVDMIFNFPHQTEAMLCRDLDILIDDISVDQVSFYPLMTVGSTRKKMSQTVGNVDYSREKGFYQIIADRMLTAGYVRSSAWCFSRARALIDEYIVDRDQYVGLGSGSFSYLQGSLFASTFSINHYISLVANGTTGTVLRRRMTDREQKRYYLMMRLFGGMLDTLEAESRFNGRFCRSLAVELAALHAYGAIKSSEEKIVLTERGYYLWVVMMREFFTGVNSLRDQMRHNIAKESRVLRAH
jgi:coproporphyrinogen III oxidase-like Fe-S oxidoreductase